MAPRGLEFLMTEKREWLDFLRAWGGRPLPEGGVGFEDLPADRDRLAADEHDLLCPVECDVLVVEGQAAASFLQGQLSCDVGQVELQQSLPGLFCNPQGRMLASFRLIQVAEQCYFLLMSRCLAEPTAASFARYIALSRGASQRVESAWQVLGLAGPGAALVIGERFGSVPGREGGCLHGEDGSLVVQVDAQGWRFACLSPQPLARELWQQWASCLHPVASPVWELLEIRAGRGAVHPATREQFLPQMLNFQLLGAISFSKGCYTGQEVVARIHYRGRLKRRMYRALVEQCSEAPQPGQQLQDSQGRECGQVVNAVDLGEGRHEMLAVLAEATAEESRMLVSDVSSRPLRLLPLPYVVCEEGGSDRSISPRP